MLMISQVIKKRLKRRDKEVLTMKIVFHEKYLEYYTHDPAAEAGRLEPIIEELRGKAGYEFVQPEPASEEDILRAHTLGHLQDIKYDTKVHEMALLAAGGAIKAAELGWTGEPAFAAIRPPGHHASSDSCWGFCFYNNISVSLLSLVAREKIKSAFVLDFDLHTGDGNINILGQKRDLIRTKILNPRSDLELNYIDEIAQEFDRAGEFDIIVASAGFDEYEKDWGHKLSTRAYEKIGKLMRKFSDEKTQGRRYALLEGGYYFQDLGKNVFAFCEGFKK